MHFVYWLHLSDQTDPYTQGYIGVTFSPNQRFKHHLKTRRVPIESQMSILYEGDRKNCFQKEREYRPKPGIGWNLAVGGSHGWKYGFIHSNKTRQKLKKAWTKSRKRRHSRWMSETAHLRKGIPHPAQSVAISGKSNGMFGRHHTDKSKAKMSQKRKGRKPFNKIELYCIFCHKHTSPSNLDRHGPGKKHCK